jgi:cyclopropane-fatty-acyl-phospholipid synthase
MGVTTSSVPGLSDVQPSIEFLANLLTGYPRRDFQVRLWDGRTWGSSRQPRLSLVLKHPGALRQMFHSPSELTLGES